VTAATVADALALARMQGIERLDAQLLVARVMGQNRVWVIAHGDAMLGGELMLRLGELLCRRAAGEPLAYLLGEREFHGLRIGVTPDVLVPRPDTETLVDWALELLSDRPAPRVIDLGTGSGAIALAIKQACPRADVHAADLDLAALAVARANGRALQLDVAWHAGSWWQAAPAGRFDLALSNPPYVPANDPHLAALRHEPAIALTPVGDRGDGLADIERIVRGAPAWLHPQSWLLVEHGAEQGVAVCSRFVQAGFSDVQTRPDLAGRPRATGGRRAK
jgi:release factor glutamine methyltransferase